MRIRKHINLLDLNLSFYNVEFILVSLDIHNNITNDKRQYLIDKCFEWLYKKYLDRYIPNCTMYKSWILLSKSSIINPNRWSWLVLRKVLNKKRYRKKKIISKRKKETYKNIPTTRKK